MAQDTAYLEARLPALGTWNADANPANLGDAEFTEVRNLRQSIPGQYDVRTNYKDFHVFTGGSALSGEAFEVICQCEYRFIDANAQSYLFDVVFFQENYGGGANSRIKALALNRKVIAGTTYWTTQYNRYILRNNDDTADLLIKNALAAMTAPVEGFATQYGSAIALTLYGHGVFYIYPVNSAGVADPDTWSIRTLGKTRATTPYELTFADTYEGDLFLTIFDHTLVSSVTDDFDRVDWYKAKFVGGDTGKRRLPPYAYERIPLGAKYFLSSNAGFNDTALKFWEFHGNDPAAVTVGRSVYHLQARGWGYRFVFVRKFKDARGNTVTMRTQASTDCWVPNMIYCPPQVYDETTDVPKKRKTLFDTHNGGINVINDWGPGVYYSYGFTENEGLNDFVARPTMNDLKELGQKWLRYQGLDKLYSTVYTTQTQQFETVDEEMWLPFMWWVGFRRVRAGVADSDQALLFANAFDTTTPGSFLPGFAEPYFCEVPASELASAPLTKFKWSQFATLDGTNANPNFPWTNAGQTTTDVTEIEIYRTAFNESDGEISLDGIDQPLFQPHLYGYVGSLKAPDSYVRGTTTENSEFIDDVKDEDVDFGFRPDDEDGFLEGNMSGKTITVYKGKIVIGDVSFADSINAPWQEYQCFLYGSGTIPATALSEKRFYIQYVDSDGNLSAATQLTEIGAASAATWKNVVAVIPVGYSPEITAIRFLYYDGANYKLVKTVAPDDGYVIASDAEITAAPTVSVTATTITVKEPGTILWSKHNDAFAWPGLNYLAVHPTAPVTALHQIIGELWVWTDRSTSLTNTEGRFEIENEDVGCIGRFASTKVDKIVFFLSASGMYFAESSGIVQFPGYVQTLVEDYTTERITAVEDLKNVRRSALGWLARERELWLYLPGSNDLAGSLRARLVVYKFFNKSFIEANNLANIAAINYEFELLNNGNLAYSSGTYDAGVQSIYQPVIFTNHSDGKLFACFKTLDTTKIHTMDVDNEADGNFTGNAYLEKAWPLGNPTAVKLLRGITLHADLPVSGGAQSRVYVRHGAPRQDGVPDYFSGLVWTPGSDYQFIAPASPNNTPLPHRVPPVPVAESTSYTPIVRFRSEAGSATYHRTSFKGITVFAALLHKHRP